MPNRVDRIGRTPEYSANLRRNAHVHPEHPYELEAAHQREIHALGLDAYAIQDNGRRTRVDQELARRLDLENRGNPRVDGHVRHHRDARIADLNPNQQPGLEQVDQVQHRPTLEPEGPCRGAVGHVQPHLERDQPKEPHGALDPRLEPARHGHLLARQHADALLGAGGIDLDADRGVELNPHALPEVRAGLAVEHADEAVRRNVEQGINPNLPKRAQL